MDLIISEFYADGTQSVKVFHRQFFHFTNNQDDQDFIQTLSCIETIYNIIEKEQDKRVDLETCKKWILALCLKCNHHIAKKRRNKLIVQLLQQLQARCITAPFSQGPSLQEGNQMLFDQIAQENSSLKSNQSQPNLKTSQNNKNSSNQRNSILIQNKPKYTLVDKLTQQYLNKKIPTSTKNSKETNKILQNKRKNSENSIQNKEAIKDNKISSIYQTTKAEIQNTKSSIRILESNNLTNRSDSICSEPTQRKKFKITLNKCESSFDSRDISTISKNESRKHSLNKSYLNNLKQKYQAGSQKSSARNIEQKATMTKTLSQSNIISSTKFFGNPLKKQSRENSNNSSKIQNKIISTSDLRNNLNSSTDFNPIDESQFESSIHKIKLNQEWSKENVMKLVEKVKSLQTENEELFNHFLIEVSKMKIEKLKTQQSKYSLKELRKL